MKFFYVFFCFLLFCHCNSKSEENKKEVSMQKDNKITLPEPSYKGKMSVEEALLQRRSIRSYSSEPLTLQELSQILWSAYGITKEIPGGPSFLRGGLRTAPSAGALYPLDIYVVSGNVTGLKAGIYKYISEEHSLELIASGDYRKDLCKAGLSQTMIEEAPANLVYTAIFERTTSKYGKRGRERYVCMDLGHSAQNVYLQATALGIGTCAIGAFDDDAVSKVLKLPKIEEPLYIMPLGKLKK